MQMMTTTATSDCAGEPRHSRIGRQVAPRYRDSQAGPAVRKTVDRTVDVTLDRMMEMVGYANPV
jgi:hypothetical protein